MQGGSSQNEALLRRLRPLAGLSRAWAASDTRPAPLLLPALPCLLTPSDVLPSTPGLPLVRCLPLCVDALVSSPASQASEPAFDSRSVLESSTRQDLVRARIGIAEPGNADPSRLSGMLLSLDIRAGACFTDLSWTEASGCLLVMSRDADEACRPACLFNRLGGGSEAPSIGDRSPARAALGSELLRLVRMPGAAAAAGAAAMSAAALRCLRVFARSWGAPQPTSWRSHPSELPSACDAACLCQALCLLCLIFPSDTPAVSCDSV